MSTFYADEMVEMKNVEHNSAVVVMIYPKSL